jgi:hypothetical protein
MKKFFLVWGNLLLMCTMLSAQQPCQDELNTANVELTKKRIQEQEWEQERKKLLDSVKIFGRLRVDYQLLSEDYKVLKSKVADVGNIEKAMYDRLVENQEKMNALLKKTTEEMATIQAQKELIEIQLKKSKEESESLKKDTTICHLRIQQGEEEKVMLQTLQQQQSKHFQRESNRFEDSIRSLQEEFRDRIVFKGFESKTGRKFPEGVYFGNKNRRYSEREQAEAYFPFEASVVRVSVDLEKEKNKLNLNESVKYAIKRSCNLLYRYVPGCKLRLKVYYPPMLAHNSNINTKKSAEFAVSELTAFLATEFDFLVNEAKMDVKYIESPAKKTGDNPVEAAKSWIDFCILD